MPVVLVVLLVLSVVLVVSLVVFGAMEAWLTAVVHLFYDYIDTPLQWQVDDKCSRTFSELCSLHGWLSDSL